MPVKQLASVRHLLVIAPNWIGDVAMATPAIRALARRYPEARLTVAARQSGCDLLAGLPWITDFVPLPPKSGVGEMRELAKALGNRPDLAVVLPHSFRAALLAWYLGARMRIGQDRGGRAWLLNRRVPPHRESGKILPIYMADEYLALAATADAVDDGKGLELAVSNADRTAIAAQLPKDRPIVAIAPGAAFGPSKCWPAERYAAVADALQERHNAVCMLLTGPGEEETRAAVLRAAKSPLLNVQGEKPTLGKLKVAIQAADLLIGNDSGPRHIAIAFQRPAICIMGPTSPRYTTSPYEKGQVLRVDVDCGPCQKPVCVTDHRCMTKISPEQVVTAAEIWLPKI